MSRLVRAELLKARTTMLPWGLLLGGLGLALLGAVASLAVASAGDPQAQGQIDVGTVHGVRTILGTAAGGNQLALVVGILLVTAEFRHRTITTTFLVVPARRPVLVAKLVAGALVGLLFAVVSIVVVFAVVLPWLAALDAPVHVGDVLRAAGGTLVTLTLWCTLGVAIGAALRNQVAAIVTGLLGFSFAASIVFAVLPELGRYLPTAAASALVGDATDTLAPWAGAVVFVGWVALTLVPAFVVLDRDVT
jgi:hypothetical protein